MDRIDFSSKQFQKLVHFDLKGAPPLITYFEQIFPLLKQLGATGLLMEYEDMFPYHGKLQTICQPDAYGKEEIKKINSLAIENDLLLIPLIQTFGHLEFLLKHDEFHELREVDRYPNSICPSHCQTKAVVLQMVQQVMDCHQGLKYVHLGADEVWHLGQCTLCKRRMEEQSWTKEYLFLDHVSQIASELRKEHPQVCFIIWDDMLRETNIEILSKSGISSLVQPMVWHYLPPDDFRLKTGLWEKYASIFPDIWVASSYKGSTEMTQLITPPRYHIANQQAWLQTLQVIAKLFTNIHGVAVTGWQRFDHFTVLCELFPVALPTLGLCLQTIVDGDLSNDGQKRVAQILGFPNSIDLDPFPRPQPVVTTPNFPGGNIYCSCMHLSNFIAEYHILMHHPSMEGGFSSFHVSQNRVNILHVDQFLPRARILLVNMETVNQQISVELSEIYYPSTVEEFLAVNIGPFLEKLRKLVRDADQAVVLNAGPCPGRR